jgi:hypothetical protein
MNGTISNLRFYDSERGGASNQINLPDGGAYTISSCVLQKGVMAQNNFSIAFCDEMSQHDFGVNTLLVENCTFIGNTPENISSGVAAIGFTPVQSIRTGQQNSATSQNNSFVGYPVASGTYPVSGGAVRTMNYPQNFSGSIYVTGSNAGQTVTETGVTLLSSQPVLDFTHPGTGPWTGIARPGNFYWMFDGNSLGGHAL